MNASEFHETPAQNMLAGEQRDLLSRKICELSLEVPGTRLEALILQLYDELERAGISLKPKVYLADEWGCPQGVPVIGVPFYLADPALCQLEGELTGIEAEEEAEVMMCLRHEAGHAFNYAYRLYRKPGWRRLFGPFSRPYREDFRPVPFSAKYVRHLPGWYAQKHPDEDFAETFAVWLTPGSQWPVRYAGTRALDKLLFVDRMARQYGRQPPLVTDETLDLPVQELTMTLNEWYDTGPNPIRIRMNLHHTLDNDLRNLFPAEQGEPAADVLRSYRRQMMEAVNRWTGLNRKVIRDLINELLERVASLGLKIDPTQTTTHVASASIFLTTLAMNYLHRGRFIDI